MKKMKMPTAKTPKPRLRARKMPAAPKSAFPQSPIAFPPSPGSTGPDGSPPSPDQAMGNMPGGMPSGPMGGSDTGM